MLTPAGGYLDTTTGLYKLGVRYYDPSMGRFTRPDPTPPARTSATCTPGKPRETS